MMKSITIIHHAQCDPAGYRAWLLEKANTIELRKRTITRALSLSLNGTYRLPAAPAPGAIAPEDGVVPMLGPGEPAPGPDPKDELVPVEGVDGPDAPASGGVLPSEFMPWPVPENGAPEDRPGPAPLPTPGGLTPGP